MSEADDLEAAREGGWHEMAAIDAAYGTGELDQAGWHDAVRGLIEPSYLGAATAEAGSGHSGTPAEWEATRGPIMTAVDHDGDVLDVGCANGLLMESLARWGAERGRRIEPYGVDISAALVDVARARLPQWADRISAANAATWFPPRQWDYVGPGSSMCRATEEPTSSLTCFRRTSLPADGSSSARATNDATGLASATACVPGDIGSAASSGCRMSTPGSK